MCPSEMTGLPTMRRLAERPQNIRFGFKRVIFQVNIILKGYFKMAEVLPGRSKDKRLVKGVRVYGDRD